MIFDSILIIKEHYKDFSFSVELYILYYLKFFRSSSRRPNGIPD